MPLGSSPTAAWLGPIRGRKPNPQAGKTSRRRLVDVYRGAPTPRCDCTASSPHGDFGASGTFFRLSPARPAPGFSSRTGPNRFRGGARISRVPAGPRGTETCCERRTIASGRSRASVGKRQRERRKSRQVTDLPCDRHAAAAAVSPAVSLFAVQHVSGPPLRRHQFRKALGFSRLCRRT
jgi:hypothetical protein